ncbi:MAG: hypothetical protein GX660_27325, partial [Clostridiaceae bacterium]|nr:hypothetical protein [Clostridiaceae bacterium]
MKRLSILNTYGINDISKERPFDDFYIDIISNELNFQKQTNSLAIKQGASPRHKKTSTTYQGDDRLVKKLPMLHNRMNGNFIEEVDYKDFEAIFTGQPIESINRKLDWISQPVLLAYFIEKIREFIPFDTNIWVVAENCFTKSQYLRSLANGYQNRKVSNKEAPKKPIHHQVIDDLFI